LSPGEPSLNCSTSDEERHPNVTILRTFIHFMEAHCRRNSAASDAKPRYSLLEWKQRYT
jgi:hypothetical protein